MPEFDSLVGTNVNIYSSRDRIRSQISDHAQEYLELRSVDLYKTSFLSYMIDLLSILAANQLFYSSTIYKEFFFVEAQLPESVYNLAKWIGYSPEKATAANANVMFTIPLAFPNPDVSFTIPSDFAIYAGGIPFLINSQSGSNFAATFTKRGDVEPTFARATSRIINNKSMTVRDSFGFYHPVFLSDDGTSASFLLPFTQHTLLIKQFIIPQSLEFYQFFSKKINFDGMDAGIKVWVQEPKPGEVLSVEDEEDFDLSQFGEEWTESEAGLYTMSASQNQFVWTSTVGLGEIFFGNGVIGKQPKPGSKVLLMLTITRGEEGRIVPGAITGSDNLHYMTKASSYTDSEGESVSVPSKLHRIQFEVTNPQPTVGGTNTPTLPEIKNAAIVNLRSKGRLVSDQDYDDINTIMGPEFPVVESKPILKRSDIKINEIMAFTRVLYHDENNLPQVVPTRNVRIGIIEPNFQNNEFTITRRETFIIDGEEYETLFNIIMNSSSMTATYDYILTNLNDTPALIHTDQPYNESQNLVGYSYIPIITIDFNVDLTRQSEEEENSSSSGAIASEPTYPLNIIANVNHIPSAEIVRFRCKMTTRWDDNQEYMCDEECATIVEDEDTGLDKFDAFSFNLSNYQTVPLGRQRFEFLVEGWARENPDDVLSLYDWRPLQRFFVDTVIRQDLADTMISTMTKTRFYNGRCNDDTVYYVHNVPVILSNYLDDGGGGGVYNRDNQRNFELIVVQRLINNLEMQDKRMLTDFINIKFPDTFGFLNNLKYNPYQHTIRSRYFTPFGDTHPSDISSSSTSGLQAGDKYIVNETIPGYDGDVKDYINYIAEYTELGNWRLIQPIRDMYVLIEDEFDSMEDKKVLAFTGKEWIDVQKFGIPITIKARIRIASNANASTDAIMNNVKDALLNYFLPKFAMNMNLDRSEITSIIRAVDWVEYCDLIEPEIDIRFNYELIDLSQKQLLDYTPQYVGFVEDSIQIEVVQS